MSKAKKVILKISVILLSGTILVAAFVLTFFTIPAKDYDPTNYLLLTSCGEENCKCRMYQEKQYFDYTSNTKYTLSVDQTMVDLDVPISWEYGFPFVSIMSYSSYDEHQPDYIIADWTELTLFSGDLESELFSMEGVDAEFTLPECYVSEDPIRLYEKEDVRYEPTIRLSMSSHPECYINAHIGFWNSEYYISFDNDVTFYKATENFFALLKENHQ